ncbi:hypothetical protein EO244_01990 [Ancylomarina salipaludis]|uniref:KAP NTPase domain-containing protein n=1 Tax=Ancylomarina salipaludis TaxID=2501299 RepID=A0A4Q1JR54_9BACT|nr:P-loop NTPase fold protein [Ancylomarina salipaludis]RXQ97678.1 hypothetical protein EO244_01990 [Ancylomarina salipaludis]
MTEDHALLETVSLESDITEISIDKPLQDFYSHLSYNERIIFSAKFGDGKTYFLNKFFEEHKDEYEAIRIFPVNYQVADNKDVFELVKRDILIHLLGNELVDDEDFFDEILYAQNYLFQNGKDILLDILEIVPSVKTPAKILKKCFCHLRKYELQKAEFEKSVTNRIEDYLKSFEDAKGIIEFDSISELICRVIRRIREKEKKVILVVDDLDRLDPAHLFRILNVVTAHIDDRIILNEEFESTTCNKFGFDKIITVFDYNNVKIIYKHLYGCLESFDGYISKFISGKPFLYSFSKDSLDFVIDHLSENCGIDKKILKLDRIVGLISSMSVRNKLKLIEPFDVEIIDEFIEQENFKITTLNTFTRLLVLLKRLSVDFASITKYIAEIGVNNTLELIGVGLYFGKRIRFENDFILIPDSPSSTRYMRVKIVTKMSGDYIEKIVFEEVRETVNLQVLKDELVIAYNTFSRYLKA